MSTEINTEELLKAHALELYLRPPAPRSTYHLGYLTQIEVDGRVSLGEVASDEPFLEEIQYKNWADSMVSSLRPNLVALGYSYDLANVHLVLYRMTPRYMIGELLKVGPDGPDGDWFPIRDLRVLGKDHIAKHLYRAIR